MAAEVGARRLFCRTVFNRQGRMVVQVYATKRLDSQGTPQPKEGRRMRRPSLLSATDNCQYAETRAVR